MDILNLYKEAKGTNNSLYDWQKEFLLQNDLLINKRKNFVLWLPTGSGKTLVAELLLLREMLIRRKSCILILPYVAIVQEKIVSLTSLSEKFGFIIEEYAGSKGRFPPIKRRNAYSIYVCTIEKAKGLVNSLIEKGWINEIGMVVVDEFHMLGEGGGRGAILEQCLCKLMFKHCDKYQQKLEKIQIIGMSATIGNINELSQFICAEKFVTNFRPIKLIERLKMQDKLYLKDEKGNWNVETHLPKKNLNCENLCKLLTNLCPNDFREHCSKERLNILSQLRDEHEGRICPILEAGILCGVAYHHSGLTNDERLLIESSYKNGIISIICSTSTLAAGVNLPARRVIIRSPHIGRQLIKKCQYLQMIGRAGRAGLDEKGDCITILKNGTEFVAFKKMLEDPLEPCISGLYDDKQREAFFLDLIVLKLCSTIDEIFEVFKNSLFGIQKNDDTELRILTEKTVQSLLGNQMLIQPEVDHFFSTQIGIATFNANFNPQMALDINRDLSENLSQGIVLSSHFHLLYNCVQMDVEVQNLDWNLFHNEYLTLKKEERELLHLMGFSEGTIVQFILYSSNKMNISVKAQRFYVTFMLRQIWEQRPLWEVAQHFDVPRGWLQSVLQSALSQASSIVRFAERTPSLWAIRSLLPEMVKRLSECTRQELIPLLSIDCVKAGRARLLYEHGYKTVGSIAKANAKKLILDLEGKLNLMQARRMISSAKSIIRDQIAEKAEELEHLGANDFFEFFNSPDDSFIQKFNQSIARRITTFKPVLNSFGFELEAEEEENACSKKSLK